MAASREKLFTLLNDLGIPFSTVEHKALHTVEESQSLRGEIDGGHSKNLFLKCKKGKLWLVTALEDTQIDLKALAKTFGAGRFSFGKPELLFEMLGVHPGSVTPFSIINDPEKKVQLVLDAKMMEEELLNFHPLENTATTSISNKNFMKFIKAVGHEPIICELNSENHE
ncbi:MAG: prolyl-tRNA synthetase associated domain-containing protein [Methyloligellaceae bacterium]